MIAYKDIENNLRWFDRQYTKAQTNVNAKYYSKLAILELCGWIEISMDDIVLRGSVRALSEDENRKLVSNKVNKNYGFEYERHFQTILIALFGVIGVERLERSIPVSIRVPFKVELKNLIKTRNSLAHTYTRGTTPQYDSPSVTIGRYQIIAKGLEAYDLGVRKIC